MSKIIRLYDRSRSTSDWSCPRKRYLNYELDGKGITPDNTPMYFYMGSALHDGLAAIATFHRDNKGEVDIDLIATTAQTQIYDAIVGQEDNGSEWDRVQFGKEQGTLIEGMLRGFYLHVWPSLIEQYPIIHAIEKEVTFIHDENGNPSDEGFVFMAKPDLVLGNDDGAVYVEYKSTSTKSDSWMNSWATAIQLHSTSKAINQTLDLDVSHVIIQGLYKGFVSYGKQSSPFCYAYMRKGNPPFTSDEISYSYKGGFKKYPTWELDGGVKEWINEMPLNVIADQFPRTPPIFIKDDLVEAFFRQRAAREREIDLAMSLLSDDEEANRNILDITFPQKFEECVPSFGSPCAYRRICHGHVVSPLEEGFAVRESHHEMENELWTQELETS